MSRGGTRVYFGRLPRDTRERDLERFVRGFGRIREVSIKLGYGFVEFDDPRDADDCVYDLNGRELLGERVLVEHAKNPSRTMDYGYRSSAPSSNSRPQRRGRTPPLRTEHRLAVENLSSRINWQDLKEYISKAGEVTFADAHKRRQGEGVVEFASKEDMKNALKKLDDTELNGRRIRLKIEKVKAFSSRRSRSRSRSKSPKRRKRSHSRSRSRSKSRSKSPKKRHRSTSRSRSHSKSRKSRSPSKEKERSRSKSADEEEEEKESPSKSPEKEEQEEEMDGEVDGDGDGDADADADAEAEGEGEVEAEAEGSPEGVNGEEENGDADQELEVDDEVEE